MRTSALVGYIQRRAKDWDRQSILDMIGDVQTIIFSEPTSYMRVIDESTGVDPVLTTVSGTYSYTISGAHVIENISSSPFLYEQTYGIPNIAMYPKFRTVRGNESVDAKIIFSEDPGDATYYVKYYRRPNELTSESIQLEIPQEYHITHVAYAVLGMIEMAEHGTSEKYDIFYGRLLDDIRSSLNSSSQDISYHISGGGY